MKSRLLLGLIIGITAFSCEYSGYSGDPASYDAGEDMSANFNEIVENPFVDASEEPISTFSVDADGASYSTVRRYIMQNSTLPPANAVRTEEFLNYFNLNYEFNSALHPIDLNGEVSTCPWNTDNKLVRIGIKGKPLTETPPSNFVFLIDVSGSMSSRDRLPLLKEGFKKYVDELTAQDRIAIVTYAGSAGVVLGSTPGFEKDKIKDAIDALGSGGGTAGAEGIITAYDIAEGNLIEGGNNRVIVGSDGNFNVGVSSNSELIELIESKRDAGVFLTVLGVGSSVNDANLEQIANHGNGTYEYIDNEDQLNKVFIHENHKFFTVAKDVKVQVEFNDYLVESYRLIGYENRVLNQEDFEDDSTDAGEIGANQNITALYEIVPKISSNYRTVPMFTINFRYKTPESDVSTPLYLEIFDNNTSFEESTDFMKFTASVASFALLLRDSEYKGSSTYDKVLDWSNGLNLEDEHRYKAQFRELVSTAKKL